MRTPELTSDTIFKYFMKSNNTRHYKAKMISLITNIPEEYLLDAKYRTEEELKVSNPLEKGKVTDIIVDINKHIINIEMNKEYYDGLLEKNAKYSSKLMSEQLQKGEKHLDTKKVIQINIDDFTKYKGNKLVYKFMMRDEEGIIEHELIESYHIDLKYLSKKSYNELNKIEKIFKLFKEENIESLRGEDYMDEAINELENISNDDYIMGLYDKEIMDRMTYNSKMAYAEKIGMEKGMEKAKIEIAKKMLEANIDIELIAKTISLPKEVINNL